jgi:sugar lactone lactonase YvrE
MRRDEDKGCEAMLIRRQGDQTRLGKERPMNKRTAATAWTTLALALVALRFGPGVARAQEIGPGVAIAQEAGTVVIDGLNGPMGVLVTPDGSVWAVDTGVGGDVEMELPLFGTGEQSSWRFGETARIVRMAPDGSQTDVARLPSIAYPKDPTYNSGGAGLAMIDDQVGDTERPRGMAALVRIDDGRGIEVANTWDSEREHNPDGYDVATNPFGLAVGPDGNLWVADAAANDLLKIDPATGRTEVVAVFDGIPSPIPNAVRGGALESEPVPTGVTFDHDGNLYVSLLPGVPFLPGSAKVVKITPDGAVTDYATGLTMLTDLQTGPDGHLYAVSLAEFTEKGPTPASGEIVRVLEGDASEVVLSGLSFPTAIDFNSAGDAYVSVNGLGEPGTGQVVLYQGLAVRSDPGH